MRHSGGMQTDERMSGVDRAWLLMERPTNPMMVTGLLLFARPLGYRALRSLVARRFLAFDRFRCRAVADTLGARWVRQDDFDLDDHVMRVALPGAAGRDELEALVAELASTPLSAQRPRWTFHLVEHYGRGSALIIRIHHCYADGIALAQVLLSLGDPVARTRRSASRRPPSSLVDKVTRAFDAAAGAVGLGVHYALHPDEAAGLAGELGRIAMLSDDPPTPLRAPLTGVRHVAWAEPYPFEDLHAAAHALGCTINDVLVAALAGALGRHLETRGSLAPGMTIRAAVPVNLRAATPGPTALGNNFGLVFLELPVGLRHPLERLYAVHAMTQELKNSPQALVTLGLLAVVGNLPAMVEQPVMEIFSAKASLVASNVPGPRQPLDFAGVRVAQAMFWVPQAGSIGVGVSMLTYHDHVQFGVMSDRAAIAHPRAVAEALREELGKLVRLALAGASRPLETAVPAS
jgi:WS/DGAT/MGAT family acyltransferase